MNFKALFDSFNSLKVAVVGDVMLDTYWWGTVDRISPEAPVPIVAIHHKELRMGGAANVALNTAALGAPTVLFSVIGTDNDGRALKNLLEAKDIDTRYLVCSDARTTTNKTRVISRNQHMLRLDAEMLADITENEERLLMERFTNYILQEKPAVVVLEDYNKGVLTRQLIQQIIALCKNHDIITTVDPKRKNFLEFKGATIFKPNLNEVKDAFNVLVDDIDETFLRNIHQRLAGHMQHQISLITLSEKGVFFQEEDDAEIIPSHVRNIADVSGAGDTLIAVASLIYAATNNIKLAASVANIAGGLVCEQVGTAAIDKARLLQECTVLINAFD